MQKTTAFLTSALLSMGCASSKNGDSAGADLNNQPNHESQSDRTLIMETSMGSFQIDLDIENAPITTANFLRYVDTGFYDGIDGLGATTFHRVVSGFVIQGGGYTPDGSEKQTLTPIENEAAASGLSNIRGTLAMARTNDPNSATSQFFVNLVNNAFLDPGESTEAGYAVFGSVTTGMDTIDTIAEVTVDASDRPLETITIERVYRLNVAD